MIIKISTYPRQIYTVSIQELNPLLTINWNNNYKLDLMIVCDKALEKTVSCYGVVIVYFLIIIFTHLSLIYTFMHTERLSTQFKYYLYFARFHFVFVFVQLPKYTQKNYVK